MMEFDTYKLCGAALVCAMAAFLLRGIKKEYEIPLTLAGSVLLISTAFAMSEPIVGYIKDLANSSPIVSDAFATLMRVIGIAMITKVSADICRDMGTPSVASSLELVAKLEIMILSLPLISSALESIRQLFAEAGL